MKDHKNVTFFLVLYTALEERRLSKKEKVT